MRMRKLVLGLSVLQIFPEKINEMLSLNTLGCIDVNRTVLSIAHNITDKKVECDL